MEYSVLLVLKLSSIFGPFFLGFIGFAVNCYIACKDLDAVLKNFKKSRIIVSYGGLWGKGTFTARYMLATIVSGSVLLPGRHIRNGVLDSEELVRLPPTIKLRMKWSVGLMAGAFLWSLLTVIVMETIKRLNASGLN
ncbi:hypothetical protein SAMN04487857_1323 [Pseudomonas sp. ok272]|uniref:hypothetical protein n=1 Tax=unclassified Pseudomonas TaxID=196821 RepID=UPI0008BF14B1|nr:MULTISPECIES: hypothetical protein [unclassified Pseudomonas]SEN65679.1 hypothetical protein SAMN04487857_1323 [Pseudomonas sp. ok272]SFN46024.1 hypothetical protein SAMN04487858_1343 [Pseudomonas sp. ok602]